MHGLFCIKSAEIAQLVEHATENRGVPSSILGLGTPADRSVACGGGSAVERLLAKEKIGGSDPLARSLSVARGIPGNKLPGDVAKWQGKGLQNPHRGFNSHRRLLAIRTTSAPPL